MSMCGDNRSHRILFQGHSQNLTNSMSPLCARSLLTRRQRRTGRTWTVRMWKTQQSVQTQQTSKLGWASGRGPSRPCRAESFRHHQEKCLPWSVNPPRMVWKSIPGWFRDLSLSVSVSLSLSWSLSLSQEKETQSQRHILEVTRAQHFAVFPSPTETPVFFSGLLVEFGWLLQRRSDWTCIHLWSSLLHRPANPENKSNSGMETWSAKYGGDLGGASFLTSITVQGCPTSPLRKKKLLNFFFAIITFLFSCFQYFVWNFSGRKCCLHENVFGRIWFFLKGTGYVFHKLFFDISWCFFCKTSF